MSDLRDAAESDAPPPPPAAPAPAAPAAAAPAAAAAAAGGGPKAEVPHVSLKVVNADGAEMYFKIKRSTPLKKLMDAYCKKQGIQRTSVRFLYDGAQIEEEKSPEELSMEDDDVIDAMVEQTGGVLQRLGRRRPRSPPASAS